MANNAPAVLTRSSANEITKTTVLNLIKKKVEQLYSSFSCSELTERLTDLNRDIEQLKVADSAKIKELYAKYAPNVELFDPFKINGE
jgi:hypothetical protein